MNEQEEDIIEKELEAEILTWNKWEGQGEIKLLTQTYIS